MKIFWEHLICSPQSRCITAIRVGFSMKQRINIFESEDKNTSHEMKNSRFTKEELAYITRQLRERKDPSEIRRDFRNMFYPKNLRKVQHATAFARVMEKLKDHCSDHSRKATGKEPLSVEAVERVKKLSTRIKSKFFIQPTSLPGSLHASFG